jgi:tetratricopeptide (TPR) repeat protein
VLQTARAANPTLISLLSALAWVEGLTADELIGIGRDAEALPAAEQAREAREGLIRANPTVARNPEQLSRALCTIGGLHLRAGRTAEALAAYRRARETMVRLVDRFPESLDLLDQLAMAEIGLGNALATSGATVEALAALERALADSRKLFNARPMDLPRAPGLAKALRHRAIVLQKCGRAAEAVAALRESILLLRGSAQAEFLSLYDIACAQALLSVTAIEPGSGLTADDGRAYADEAVATLRRCFAAGFRSVAWMLADPDLLPLRSRHDFYLLALDMAFPTDPFARDEKLSRSGH